MTARTRRLSVVPCTLVTLLVLGAIGCHSRHVVSPDQIRDGPLSRQQGIRLTYGGAWVLLDEDWKLDYPWVVGSEKMSEGEVPRELVDDARELYRYNLEDATKIELRRFSRGKTAALGLGVGYAAVAIVAVILVLAYATPLAASCPAVVVADAVSPPAIVGEAWPGATGPGFLREDWLELPGIHDASRVRVAIENHHREVQHVHAADLAFVAHPQGTLAVATPEGRPVVVGTPAPPLAALAGSEDVRGLVATRDERFWQSTQSQIVPDGSESIRATFAIGAPEEAAVLVRFENTLWMGATLALRLGEACSGTAVSSVREADGACARWRRAEGYDAVLVVTDARGTSSYLLGSAGIEGARMVAVPIGRRDGAIAIRIESGSGFVRVDQVALARVVDRAPEFVRYLPARVGFRGASNLSLAVDLRSAPALLSATGDRLDLEFLPGNRKVSGTWFLIGQGYYELQPGVDEQLAEIRAAYRRALL